MLLTAAEAAEAEDKEAVVLGEEGMVGGVVCAGSSLLARDLSGAGSAAGAGQSSGEAVCGDEAGP